jgi:DNA sulfur modification protein DndD
MRINKIELKNFGPYKGLFSLDFPKTNKNIEIITGKNGTGKTHIFNAIIWCLYGYEPSIKDKAIKEGSVSEAWTHIYGTHKKENPPSDPYMHVTLWIDSEEKDKKTRYIITRTVRPKQNAPNTLTRANQIEIDLVVSENGRECDSPKEIINSLIPVTASQFFMFHGEDLRPMSQEHLKHTQKAIELILEADLFLTGHEDLKKVCSAISSERDEELAKIQGLQDLITNKQTREQEIRDAAIDLTKLKNELIETKNNLKITETELRRYESSRVLMENLSKNNEIKEQIMDDIKKFENRRGSLVSQLPARLVLPQVRTMLEEKEEIYIKNQEIKGKLNEISGKLKLLQDLKKLPNCVCGNEIHDVEKTFIETEENSLLIQQAESRDTVHDVDPTYYDVRDFYTKLNSRQLDFSTYKKELDNLKLRLDEKNTSIKEAEKNLKGINKEEIAKLTVMRNNHLKNMGTAEGNISTTQEKIQDVSKIIDRFNRLIMQRKKNESISGNLESQWREAVHIKDSFQYILDKLVDMRKNQLVEYTSSFFTKLTNNPNEYAGIHVDDNYNVSIIDSQGELRNRSQLSTGERGVVALSFILGLKTASEKIAPLVLDTFFSHLDESHYTNIVTQLPNFAQQIILILTDLEYKQLKETAPDEFFDSINNVWSTKKIASEERSEIYKMEAV